MKNSIINQMNRKLKVIIITNIIAPYRIPLFKYLSLHPETDIKVFFYAKTSLERKWKIDERSLKFNYKILPSFILKLPRRENQPAVYFLNPTLFFSLIKENPDVIVGMDFSISSQIAFLYSKFFRKQYICLSDEAKLPFPAFKSPTFLKLLARKIIISGSSAFIASSTLARENLISLSADPQKIFISYLTTDIETFKRNAKGYQVQKEILRRKLGWNDKPIILYCGYLWKRKGLFELLQAFKILHENGSKAKLLIIGDGPLKKKMIDYCQKNNLEREIHFLGNKSQKELPLYYGLADLFILPSLNDPFGIVVLEALACGLPVICSKFAGVCKDAIVESKNGYVVDPTNIPLLATKMERALKNLKSREQMSKDSYRYLAKFNPKKVALNFIEAVFFSIKAKSKNTFCA